MTTAIVVLGAGAWGTALAAHLSRQNNTPDLARAALAGALGCEPEWIGVADQATGFAWREV